MNLFEHNKADLTPIIKAFTEYVLKQTGRDQLWKANGCEFEFLRSTDKHAVVLTYSCSRTRGEFEDEINRTFVRSSFNLSELNMAEMLDKVEEMIVTATEVHYETVEE